MAITEESRHDMYEGLTEVLGRQRATTRMEHLPPTGWGDVATKRDLEVHQAVTRADMAELKTEIKTEMAELKTEIKTEMADLKTEMAGLRTDLKAGLEGLRAEMHKGFAQTFRWAVGANFALLGVAVAVLKMS